MFRLVSRLIFLMLFGSGFGSPGLENQASANGCIAKISFQRSWNSNGFMIIFQRFLVSLRSIFMTLYALDIGLKFDDFSE